MRSFLKPIALAPTRKCVGQFSYFHKQATVAAPGLIGRLFGKKDKQSKAELGVEDQQTNDSEETKLIKAVRSKISNKTYASSETLKPRFLLQSMPKKKVENRLKTILTRCDVEQDSVDWKATPLTERNVKFRVLTLAMRHIRLPISNRALNNIQTVGDLLEEFDQKPVTTDAGHPVAVFYKENADQLPANMKFEPFQGRNSRTHVHQ